MKFIKYCFSHLLSFVIVLLAISVSSCAAQQKAINATNNDDEKPVSWRVEIHLQQNNTSLYDVLAVLENSMQPVSLNHFNYSSEKPTPGMIIVYVTATNAQAQQLRQALFDNGAIAVMEDKESAN